MTPRTDLTQDDLDFDNNWLQAGRTMYSFIEGKSFTGNDEELKSWNRSYASNQLYNISSGLITLTKQPSTWTQEQKEAYNYLVYSYDNTSISWRGTGNALWSMVQDPISWVSFFTGGIAGSARPAVNYLFREAIRAGAENAVQNYIEQNIQVGTGYRKEISETDLLIAGAFGTITSAGLFGINRGLSEIKSLAKNNMSVESFENLAYATNDLLTIIDDVTILNNNVITAKKGLVTEQENILANLKKYTKSVKKQLQGNGKEVRQSVRELQSLIKKANKTTDLSQLLEANERLLKNNLESLGEEGILLKARLTTLKDKADSIKGALQEFTDIQAKITASNRAITKAKKNLEIALRTNKNVHESQEALTKVTKYQREQLQLANASDYKTTTNAIVKSTYRKVVTNIFEACQKTHRDYQIGKSLKHQVDMIANLEIHFSKNKPDDVIHVDLTNNNIKDIDTNRATRAGLLGNNSEPLQNSIYFDLEQNNAVPSLKRLGSRSKTQLKLQHVTFNMTIRNKTHARLLARPFVQQLAEIPTEELPDFLMKQLKYANLNQIHVASEANDLYIAFLKSHIADTVALAGKAENNINGLDVLYKNKLADLQSRLGYMERIGRTVRTEISHILNSYKQQRTVNINDRFNLSKRGYQAIQTAEKAFNKYLAKLKAHADNDTSLRALASVSKEIKKLIDKPLRPSKDKKRTSVIESTQVDTASKVLAKIPQPLKRAIDTTKKALSQKNNEIRVNKNKLDRVEKRIEKVNNTLSETNAQIEVAKLKVEQADLKARQELLELSLVSKAIDEVTDATKTKMKGIKKEIKAYTKNNENLVNLKPDAILNEVQKAFDTGDTDLASKLLVHYEAYNSARIQSIIYDSEYNIYNKVLQFYTDGMYKVLEFAISNVFSLGTLSLNILGSAPSLALRPLLNTLIHNPFSRTKWLETAGTYSAMKSSMKGAFELALEAFRYENEFSGSTSISRVFDSNHLAIKGTKGSVIRTIPRLMTATDRFLSEIACTQYIALNQATKTMKNMPINSTNSQIIKQIKTDVQNIINNDRNNGIDFVESVAPIMKKGLVNNLEGKDLEDYIKTEMQRDKMHLWQPIRDTDAIEYADDILFKSANVVNDDTRMLGRASAYVSTELKKSPFMQFFTGQFFVRSTINTLDTALQYTPILNMFTSNIRKDLNGLNGALRQQYALSVMYMAQGATLAGLALYASGSLTGGEHYMTATEQRLNRDSGKPRPYSIKFGDSSWSFNSVAGISIPLKIIGNLCELSEHLHLRQQQGEYIDEDKLPQNPIMAVFGVLFNSLGDNPLITLAKEFNEIYSKVIEDNNESFIVSYLDKRISTLMPRALTAMYADDDLTATTTIGQSFKKRIFPFEWLDQVWREPFDNYYNSLNPIKTSHSYTVLGLRRKSQSKSYFSAFSDIRTENDVLDSYTTTQADVMKKLSTLAYKTGARFQSKFKHNSLPNTDLRNIISMHENKTLFDRWHELYATLTPENNYIKILNSKLPDSSKVALLQKTMTKYYDMAFIKLQREDRNFMNRVIKQKQYDIEKLQLQLNNNR